MFIFLRNVARDYAWGDGEAIAELTGEDGAGQPQAELWFGTHEDDPADLAHTAGSAETLLDLVQGDVDKYGVDGAGLPFLLKVLGIGQALSVQVHPNRSQAVEGFERENELGVPRDAPNRNYRDMNHKPEVVVALSDDFAALAGFRLLAEVVRDLRSLASDTGTDDNGYEGDGDLEALLNLADWLGASTDDELTRREVLEWVFSGSDAVRATMRELQAALDAFDGVNTARVAVLRRLFELHPGDPGILVSLLMHLVELRAGEALYLPPRHIHAYLSGVAIEVMASSDNVLRAGLTQKHVDVPELMRVIELAELASPRLEAVRESEGVELWQPGVPDFSLRRVRVGAEVDSAELGAEYPLVLICTEGAVVAERSNEGLDEYAKLKRGQALYVSAGAPVTFSGRGELFVATVGATWGKS